MPTSKTKALAKKLGLIKKRKATETTGNARKRRKGQLLSHLVVIDFESTCWEDKRGNQEIIEFPAVVLDLASGEVVSEFHQYVQPQEHPRLSKFCTELTGITQTQVDQGVPLPTCIRLFNQWLRQLRDEQGIELMEPGREYSEGMTLSALVTWTDWDLGVCLNYECRRKQIRKPSYFNQWIDVKSIYKTFYDRAPRGLFGALEDLGMTFTGREHSGLDDARNTARLCYRITRDGCKLSITKCIQAKVKAAVIKPPVLLQPPSTFGCGPSTEEKPTRSPNREHKNNVSQVKPVFPVTEPMKTAGNDNHSGNLSTHGTTPLKVLQQMPAKDCPIAIPQQESGASLKTQQDVQSSCQQDCTLSLKPTAPDVLWQADPGQEVTSSGETEAWNEDDELMADIANELDMWEGVDRIRAELAPTSVVSVSREQSLQQPLMNARCENDPSTGWKQEREVTKSVGSTLVSDTPSRVQCIAHISPVTLLASAEPHLPFTARCSKAPTFQCQSDYSPKVMKQPLTSHTSTKQVTAAPALLTPSPANNSLSPSVLLTTPPNVALTTPTVQPQGTVSRHTHHVSISPRSSTSMSLEDGDHPARTPSPAGSSGGFRTPSTVQWMKLKMASQQLHTPHHSPREPLTAINGGKVTPPLCNCGRRTRRKLVSSPGPNEGKPFYACPLGRGSEGGKGCGFFCWEQASASSPNSSCSSVRSAGYSSPDIFSEYCD